MTDGKSTFRNHIQSEYSSFYLVRFLDEKKEKKLKKEKINFPVHFSVLTELNKQRTEKTKSLCVCRFAVFLLALSLSFTHLYHILFEMFGLPVQFNAHRITISKIYTK